MARKPASPKTLDPNDTTAETPPATTAETPPTKPLDLAVIDAALVLAADRPWSEIALADIANAAGISLIDLYRTFRSKPAILAAFARRIDAATIDLPADAGATARDRLFEVLMHRFDQLAPFKPGLRGLAREARRGRLDMLAMACHLPRSLGWVLEASGISGTGLKGAVRVRVLGLAYLSTVRVWLQDDSEDLTKTMAALDKALKRAEPFLRLQASSTTAAAA